jgi:hypothetical protein
LQPNDLVLTLQRQPRLRFVWQEEDDTAEAIRAKICDMIESRWAREGDHFVTFGWRPPEDEGATIEPARIVFSYCIFNPGQAAHLAAAAMTSASR